VNHAFFSTYSYPKGVIERDKRQQENAMRQIQNRYLFADAFQQVPIWGGCGFLLTSFHSVGLPHWGGFALTNVLLRMSLSPLVLYSAHTASRFATVAPEIQFLVTLFQNDLVKQRQEGASFNEQRTLIFKTLQTLSGIYKLHKINPLSVFMSPLLQIPFFMYVSIDLRKIINGADPELAQQLTEGGLFWFKDLTEPDTWYCLPILGGLLLYYNVEVAIGKQSLSGETASKSNVALYLKDFFQSLAVFMPCFMSQSPAGIQIYLITSFIFTYYQGQALRSDAFRGMVGLPLRSGAPNKEAKYAQEFIKLKKLERKAREERGDGEVLGKGVLAAGLEASFAGSKRQSTIVGSGVNLISQSIETKTPRVHVVPPVPVGNAPFVHGISAPAKEFKASEKLSHEKIETQHKVMEEPTEIEIERANLGQPPIEIAKPSNRNNDADFDVHRFKSKKRNNKKRRK